MARNKTGGNGKWLQAQVFISPPWPPLRKGGKGIGRSQGGNILREPPSTVK